MSFPEEMSDTELASEIEDAKKKLSPLLDEHIKRERNKQLQLEENQLIAKGWIRSSSKNQYSLYYKIGEYGMNFAIKIQNFDGLNYISEFIELEGRPELYSYHTNASTPFLQYMTDVILKMYNISVSEKK